MSCLFYILKPEDATVRSLFYTLQSVTCVHLKWTSLRRLIMLRRDCQIFKTSMMGSTSPSLCLPPFLLLHIHNIPAMSPKTFGSRYSSMDNVKFVEDSLWKICSDVVCLVRPYNFKFFKSCLPQILLVHSWITWPICYEKKLKVDEITYPASLKDINRFEK